MSAQAATAAMIGTAAARRSLSAPVTNFCFSSKPMKKLRKFSGFGVLGHLVAVRFIRATQC